MFALKAMMKKYWKIAGLTLLALIGLGALTAWVASRPLPEGVQGPQADALAQKMLESVNQEAWDSTAWVQWTFAGRRHFLWDKERHFVRVGWGEREVLLNLEEISGLAFRNGQAVDDEKNDKLVQKAWAAFCNDSFWLNAVVKAFDPGTERRLVDWEGRSALLITYTSGGVTPGDSYLWLLDEQGRPEAWRIWASILPIGGVRFQWEDWTQLPGGAWVATTRKHPLLTLNVTDLQAAGSWQELGLSSDPFASLVP